MSFSSLFDQGKIENAEELLDEFLETFLEEPPVVQHQLLTAIVKLALLPDRESVDILQRVLSLNS